MPRGVSDQFLRIIQHERKARWRATITMLALTPLAYLMSELVDEPLFGKIVILTAVIFLVAILAGIIMTHLRLRKLNDSLLDKWNAWQRASLNCTRLYEVARQVEGKDRAPALGGLGWAVLLLANIALFAALWIEAPGAYVMGIVVSVVNAATLGLHLGAATRMIRWTHTIRNALDELIAEGKIGFWGEA